MDNAHLGDVGQVGVIQIFVQLGQCFIYGLTQEHELWADGKGLGHFQLAAAGAPVVGYGKAGTLDIVEDGKTGILFSHQTIDEVIDAIKRLTNTQFDTGYIAKSAERFDKQIFIKTIKEIVDRNWKS